MYGTNIPELFEYSTCTHSIEDIAIRMRGMFYSFTASFVCIPGFSRWNTALVRDLAAASAIIVITIRAARSMMNRIFLHSSIRRTLATLSPAEQREAERLAKRARRNALAERQAAARAYLASQADVPRVAEPTEVVDETRGPQWRQEEREVLLEEAGFLARSLYRACIRSIKLMRPGNQHDEDDFKEREERQFSNLNDEKADLFFSMRPPVDRKNELRSRAEYYHAHLRENFNSDSQCLDKNPWNEHDIQACLYFLRHGEKSRRYILKDYRFEDPYSSKYDVERINKFEARAVELLRDTYKANGRVLLADTKPEDYETEYDQESKF